MGIKSIFFTIIGASSLVAAAPQSHLTAATREGVLQDLKAITTNINAVSKKIEAYKGGSLMDESIAAAFKNVHDANIKATEDLKTLASSDKINDIMGETLLDSVDAITKALSSKQALIHKSGEDANIKQELVGIQIDFNEIITASTWDISDSATASYILNGNMDHLVKEFS